MIESEIKTIDASQFNWKKYYEDGEKCLKISLEEDLIKWDNFINSKLRYILVSSRPNLDNNVNKTQGTWTGYFDFRVYSDSVIDLKNLWEVFFKNRIDTTMQHFIADLQNKTIVEFLSVGL